MVSSRCRLAMPFCRWLLGRNRRRLTLAEQQRLDVAEAEHAFALVRCRSQKRLARTVTTAIGIGRRIVAAFGRLLATAMSIAFSAVAIRSLAFAVPARGLSTVTSRCAMATRRSAMPVAGSGRDRVDAICKFSERRGHRLGVFDRKIDAQPVKLAVIGNGAIIVIGGIAL